VPLPLALTIRGRPVRVELVHVTPGFRWELIAFNPGRVGYWIAGGPWGVEANARRDLWADGWHLEPDTPVARLLLHLHAEGHARCRYVQRGAFGAVDAGDGSGSANL
jgi:hypothetical protein